MLHVSKSHIARKFFLLTGIFLLINLFAHAQLVINEVSQGPSGSKEYVELVVAGTPTCTGIPCMDLRGYYIDDNNGNHATGSGTGIAPGCIRFSTNALWSCVPAGTIIVIYNDGDLNAAIPAVDLSLTDGNCRLVIPVSNCTLLEKHTTLPSTSSSTYPSSGFSSCGSWTNISMANGDDSFQSIDPSGALVHSVSWGNNLISPVIYFAGSAGGKVAWNNNSFNTNPSLQGNWSFTAVAGNETPGAPNNTANAAWIASMNNNCSPFVPLSATVASTNASCTCTGTATVSPSGGISPYTFSWAPTGGNSSTASSLCAGSYTCTITDAAGCTQTVIVTITAAGTLSMSGTSNAVTCNGGCNGSAATTIVTGTAPFTYVWAPSGGNSATATGLCAGNYSCTVTDASGCTGTQTFSITQPSALSLSSSQTNLICNGGNSGAASVSVSGGTPGYSYAWTPSGGTAATATGLSAGSYTCSIADINGCTLTQTFLITQPAAITATTSQTSISCNGGTASATVVPSGGTPSYSYAWTPSGGNAAAATGLAAGSYSCTITDANGCNRLETFSITQPNAFTIAPATLDVTCNGGNNGAASVIVSGGTPSYSYSWSPSGGTSSSASSLTAGNYSCTITDNNGCSATQTFSLTQPVAIAATTSQTNVSCNGGNNGAATVIPSGGNPGYTYSWSPTGGTNANATSLAAGTYTCMITDASGCTNSEIISITQPTPLVSPTASSTNISCNGGNDGFATVYPSGGTPSYSYAWTPVGGTAASANLLIAGNYSCTITDQAGCTITQTFLLTEPPALSVSVSSTPSNCTNPDGSVSVVASGGNGTYSYAWSPGAYNTATVNAVSAGNYSVTVTDQNGCSINSTVTVSNVNGVVASLVSQTNINCAGQSTGAIYITQNGGTPGYNYNWSPNISTADSATSLTAGNYSVTVTDANSCMSSVSITITEPPQLIINASANPAGVCAGESVQLNAITGGGTPAYNVVWNPGNLTGNNPVIFPQTSTTYTSTVTDQNGCTANTLVNVVVYPSPSAVFTADSTAGCAPVCVNFSDVSTIAAPASVLSWNWDFGDGNNSSVQNPSHCFSTTGSYPVQLTVTSSDGCNSTVLLPALINVFPTPVAAFTSSPSSISILDPQVFFTDSSLNATSWNWNFGDFLNSSSFLQNPSFIYSEPVCYQVTLTVSNSTGCSNATTHEICIDPEVSLFVPNAFTPNGDGNNDIFTPKGEGLTNDNYALLIFDRWGNLIFESHALENGWDGKARGHSEISQVDTYVWKLSVIDLKNQHHYLEGHVNLLK